MQPLENRTRRIAEMFIAQLRLNLSGLTVFTEAASGTYLVTPLIAAMAGADTVFAVTADSKFARATDVMDSTRTLARSWGFEDRVILLKEKDPIALGQSDIVMNAGFVRPITRKMVYALKPTAVIPLMWETWEFRTDELDLNSCRERGIVVLGTNEGTSTLDLYPSTGFLAVKLLQEMGFEGFWTRVILLGGRLGMGASIAKHFTSIGIPFVWFANGESSALCYESLPDFIRENGGSYDVLLLAEHSDPRLLIGEDGLLTFDEIRLVNPSMEIAVIAGNLCLEGLRKSGLPYFPRHIRGFGHLSYPGYNLGPLTPTALFTMALKVGEVAARARLSGLSPLETVRHALRNSLVMDFQGELSWI